MNDKSTNKKTVEEGKNIKGKKENPDAEKTSKTNNKTKTSERTDVNNDVDQE